MPPDEPDGQVKVHADLDVDDGYPPVDVESLWCLETEPGHFVLDNIPVFLLGVALGDVLETSLDLDTGTRRVHGVARSGGHSTLLAMFAADPVVPAEVGELREDLRSLGCESEYDAGHGIAAIDVPPDVAITRVEELLNGREVNGQIHWWVGVLRHAP